MALTPIGLHPPVNPEWPVGLFVDYWKHEEKTKEVVQHGYYYTLDKAYR